MEAIAISNNDVVFLAWRTDAKIANCLGFSIRRIDKETGSEAALPAWVGFEGDSNSAWTAKTTDIWPIQKFTWRDLTATRGRKYRYRIFPQVGQPGRLTSHESGGATTNEVVVSEHHGPVSAYFNRGILATQSLARQLPLGAGGFPNYRNLLGRIDQPGDPLRNRLSGQLREAMLGLFKRVREQGGQLYCALYELNDPELEQALLAGRPFVHVILSNTGPDDATNRSARQALHDADVPVVDRILPSGHIGHNKFVIYTGSDGTPLAVWTGSTNWTDTGLCAQSNNGVLIESPELAAVYLSYWKRLMADESNQSADFRSDNGTAHNLSLDATNIQAWFSPNTARRTKPTNGPVPADLEAVFARIQAAKTAILFLLFQPGAPSVVEQIAQAQDANAGLFVHGAVTDPHAIGSYDTHLFHRTSIQTDTDVVAAAAIEDQVGFWERELLKAGPRAHAIIHDKILVIDPFSDDCTVVTGSHNLGYSASYANDENFLVIRGNRSLAAAYAVHVMDIYDHYRWRFALQQRSHAAWSGLSRTDNWQDAYLARASAKGHELAFWMLARRG